MRTIPLSNSDQVALVDDEDFDRISPNTWSISKNGRAHAWDKILKRHADMAKLIMSPPCGLEVDHIDRNRLNNQKSNLRFATRAQNSQNKGKYKGACQYKGVRWRNPRRGFRGGWEAQIVTQYRTYYLGYFDDPRDAATAYNVAALEKFGEFAHLNAV